MQSTKEEAGRLKVSGRFRDNTNTSAQIPEIRISGLLLERVGFGYGKPIVIVLEERMLTIHVLEE
jgi:hypothetical protein